MAAIPCDIPCIICAPGPGGGVGPVDPANPFINISSEAPDVDVFYGRRYGPGGGFPLPPLGSTWYASGCIGFCVSTISQEDANLCAQVQAVLCAGTNWPVTNPNNPLDPPVDRPVFYNQAQFAQFQCPDGTPYYFTVAAGIFSSFNQDTANQMAYSYALNQGSAIRVCLGSLTPTRICAGSSYSGSITASIGQGRASFAISAGSLPDGLVLSQSNTVLFITGTPTTPGDYTFSVTATDPNGVQQTKTYTIVVFGISTASPLPDAQLNQPYSEILSYAGTAAGSVTWAVTSGSLPSGLTLNSSTGEISGTPDFEGLQGFTISVNDTVLTCAKAFLMTVEQPSSFEGFTWDVEGTFGTASEATDPFGASAIYVATLGIESSGAYLRGSSSYTSAVVENYNLVVNSFDPNTTAVRITILQDSNPLLDLFKVDLTGPFPQSFPFSLQPGVASLIELTTDAAAIPNCLAYCDAGTGDSGSIDFTIEPA